MRDETERKAAVRERYLARTGIGASVHGRLFTPRARGGGPGFAAEKKAGWSGGMLGRARLFVCVSHGIVLAYIHA